MSLITQEQADKIKGIIDNDANLAGKYLEIKGIPDLYNFQVESWHKEHPRMEMWKATEKWYRDTEAKYAEHVNTKLLPENITGACVVGGLAVAMAAANSDIGLFNLWKSNNAHIEAVDKETVEAIETYFGLSFPMLDALQDINDLHRHDGGEFWGKPQDFVTAQRRAALKAQVDRFVTGEPSQWWSPEMEEEKEEII